MIATMGATALMEPRGICDPPSDRGRLPRAFGVLQQAQANSPYRFLFHLHTGKRLLLAGEAFIPARSNVAGYGICGKPHSAGRLEDRRSRPLLAKIAPKLSQRANVSESSGIIDRPRGFNVSSHGNIR
jgi:hypothetical protein